MANQRNQEAKTAMNGNKIAMVTGAGSGIGRGASLGLQAAGFSVVLVGRRQAELEKTASMAKPSGGRMLVAPTDVTRPAEVQALFAKTKETFGRLDVLFNNAGKNSRTAFEDLTYEEWESIVAVNLTGSFLCAQAAYRMMKSQVPQGGRIINNGSTAAYSPRPNGAPYGASKTAITGLTKSIAIDGRKYNIACSQLDLGNVATELSQALVTGVLQPDGSIRPEPRMDVQYAADAVVWMASLPLDTNAQFLTLMPTNMPLLGRG
jgi:NAD(P)-dependent dehydrogenase (short-subunit alcohol dehydrogenase family)